MACATLRYQTMTISASHQQRINHNPVNPQILDILIQTITISASHQQRINYQRTIQTVGWVERSETQQINHHILEKMLGFVPQPNLQDQRSHL